MMQAVQVGLTVGGLGFLRWIPWLYHVATSSIFTVVPFIAQTFATMPPSRAFRSMCIALIVLGAAWLSIGQVYAYWEELDRQHELSRTAAVYVLECEHLQDLKEAPGVQKTCYEARRILRRRAWERALEVRYYALPSPFELGAFFLATVEQRLLTFGSLALLLSVLLPFVFMPPYRVLRDRYVRRKITKVYPDDDEDDEIIEDTPAPAPRAKKA